MLAELRNTAIGSVRLAGKANIAAAFRRDAAHPNEALALGGLASGSLHDPGRARVAWNSCLCCAIIGTSEGLMALLS